MLWRYVVLTEPRRDPDARSVRVTESERAVDILAYCLMPNHFHLLVRAHCDDFSDRMAALCKSYTQAINKRRDRVGPLFQGRYKAAHVAEESYLLHLTRYIHLNPVVAGLVGSPSDWEFSSYRDFVVERRGRIPSPEIVLSVFGGVGKYRDFVDASVSSAPSGLNALFID